LISITKRAGGSLLHMILRPSKGKHQGQPLLTASFDVVAESCELMAVRRRLHGGAIRPDRLSEFTPEFIRPADELHERNPVVSVRLDCALLQVTQGFGVHTLREEHPAKVQVRGRITRLKPQCHLKVHFTLCYIRGIVEIYPADKVVQSCIAWLVV